MNAKIILSLLLVAGLVNAAGKIDKSSCHVPSRFGKASLFHKDGTFYVGSPDRMKPIENHWVDKPLRNIDKQKLGKFLAANGYLNVNQLDNGEYTLKANGKLKGGGPATAAFLYWLTKSACWGGVAVVATGGAVGVGVAIASSGGTAAPLIGVATQAAIGGMVATTGAGMAGATGASIIIGSSVVATEVATAAVIGGGATVGAVGLVGGIEAASWSAFAFGMALPLP